MFWPEEKIASLRPDVVFGVCEDASDAQPAEGLFFPRASSDMELDCQAREYKTGVCLRYKWDASSRRAHAERALNCAKHAALEPPATEDGFPEVLRVPGQLQLTAGVPVSMWSPAAEGRNGRYEMTAAALHTPSSLGRIPGLDASRVSELPLYELKYKHNQRDTGSHASDCEGSYSMAVTVGEGQGAGHVQPAQQSDDPYMQQRQQQLLCDSGELSPMVLESSMDKFTFDVVRQRGITNNGPCYGHVSNVFFTGLQINVSFMRRSGESLIESLGRHQGCNHIDPKDCTCAHTVFILLCTMPEGSDPGPFCFPEHGMYSHTAEKVEGCSTQYGPVFAAFLTFKGRHLHGGFAPRAFWQHAFSGDGSEVLGVRVGLVNYGGGPALNRTGTFATGPPNGYSAATQHSVRKEQQRSLLEAGLTLFGTMENMATWTARENWYAAYNDRAIASALAPFLRMRPISLCKEISGVEYEDEEGTVRHVSAFGVLDPTEDHDAYIRQARLFAYVYDVSVHFNLGITKSKVKVSRALARSMEGGKLEVPPFAVGDEVRIEADEDVRSIVVARSVNEVSRKWCATSKGKVLTASQRNAYALEFGDGRVVWAYGDQWYEIRGGRWGELTPARVDGPRKRECLAGLGDQGWETQFDVLESVRLDTGASWAEEELWNVQMNLDRMDLDDGSAVNEDGQGVGTEGGIEVEMGREDGPEAASENQTKADGTRPKRTREKAGGVVEGQKDASNGKKRKKAAGTGRGRKRGRKCGKAKGGISENGDSGAVDGKGQDVNDKDSVIEDEPSGGEMEEEERPKKRQRTRPKPPPPVEAVLEGMSWDGVLENLVAGRDGLTSAATVRRTTAEVLAQLAELGSGKKAGGVVQDAGAAMVSLHRAIDCARAYSAAHAASVAGEIVVMSSKMALARSVVEIKNWVLIDGPSLAHKIFKEVLEVGVLEPRLEKIGVSWIDELASEIFRVASIDFGLQTGGKKPGSVKKAITLPAIGDIGRAGSQAAKKIRISARLVEKAVKSKAASGGEDMSVVLACESDDDEYADWEDDDYDEDRSDDDDYRPLVPQDTSQTDAAPGAEERTLDGSEAGPTKVREKVDVAIPSARDKGRHSALAKLQPRTFNLSFQAYATPGVRRYNSLVTCFVETLFALLIEPALRRANWQREFEFEESERTKEDGTHTTTQRLLGLVVARGWVYQLLAETARTETVWTHQDITRLTRRPENNFAKYSWVVTRMSDPIRTTYMRYVREGVQPSLCRELADFAKRTENWFQGHPEVMGRLAEIDSHFRYMADEFHRGQLERGDPLLPEGFRGTAAGHARLLEGESGERSMTDAKTRKGALPSDLTSHPSEEKLRMAAMMLGMAFEREREGGGGERRGQLREAELFFAGKARGGSGRLTHDQMNPVPAFWMSRRLLSPHITPEGVRTATGMKTLLTAIATGQSMATSEFLQAWMKAKPGTREEMQQLYEVWAHKNEVAAAGAGPPDDILTEAWLTNHSAYRPLENMCVYGTACREFTFEGGARIATLWGDKVDDWLKDLLAEHGEPGSLLSWEGMAARVRLLGVKPFRGRGLAMMQLCNELAELRVCREATVGEMGRWIWHNKDKGSFKGLQELGFGPLNDVNDAVHALQMWNDHLFETMTDEQKRRVRFGVRFAENFLCKISRARRAHERMQMSSSMKAWEDAYFEEKGEMAMVEWDKAKRVRKCDVYVAETAV
ncbi:hypothetical protein AURDEDRAFT_131436 [Auricularia subglabra TFB-10046 SS5]|uniref:Uncharacterized protein n=1 Tax=Auricularia subglabra (strain TFB-10046 / SS5) TaxID=717982 RepID=J0WPV0_AURST|nr:hypothetical protein AURDEDRAFT_131436 [Auricularia subglabra TFB-10046 SS5]